jgi:hypothetical protein
VLDDKDEFENALEEYFRKREEIEERFRLYERLVPFFILSLVMLGILLHYLHCPGF